MGDVGGEGEKGGQGSSAARPQTIKSGTSTPPSFVHSRVSSREESKRRETSPTCHASSWKERCGSMFIRELKASTDKKRETARISPPSLLTDQPSKTGAAAPP